MKTLFSIFFICVIIIVGSIFAAYKSLHPCQWAWQSALALSGLNEMQLTLGLHFVGSSANPKETFLSMPAGECLQKWIDLQLNGLPASSALKPQQLPTSEQDRKGGYDAKDRSELDRLIKGK